MLGLIVANGYPCAKLAHRMKVNMNICQGGGYAIGMCNVVVRFYLITPRLLVNTPTDVISQILMNSWGALQCTKGNKTWFGV